MGYEVNKGIYIYMFFVTIYVISGFVSKISDLQAIYGYFDKEMMITHQILRCTFFSNKPAHVGSMDMFQPASWFPTVFSLGVTINHPCFCHVSNCKDTPGPPPLLTQWHSPATMARVFINPGAI